MKRWTLKAGANNLDGMALEDAPLPEPRHGEVRVRVHAASLNYRDHLVVTQPEVWRTARDIIPVADGAGVIDAVGPGVEQWAVGDAVVTLYFRDFLEGPPHADMGYGLGSLDEDGVLAEYVVLPAKRVTRAPATLDHAEASTLPCAALTAWSTLQGAYPIKQGSKVLVLGTGGVSLFALALARALGAEVTATTSQNSKRHKLEVLGAVDVINYKDVPDWGKLVFERTGGVDKVVNAAGTGSLNQSLAALRPGGDVGVMGLMTFGDPVDPLLLMGKGLIIRGISVGNAEAFTHLVSTVDDLGIKPLIGRRFRFEDAKSAFQAQVSPELFGKVVIDVMEAFAT